MCMNQQEKRTRFRRRGGRRPDYTTSCKSWRANSSNYDNMQVHHNASIRQEGKMNQAPPVCGGRRRGPCRLLPLLHNGDALCCRWWSTVVPWSILPLTSGEEAKSWCAGGGGLGDVAMMRPMCRGGPGSDDRGSSARPMRPMTGLSIVARREEPT